MRYMRVHDPRNNNEGISELELECLTLVQSVLCWNIYITSSQTADGGKCELEL